MAKYIGKTDSGHLVEFTQEEHDILMKFRHDLESDPLRQRKDIAQPLQAMHLRALSRLHDLCGFMDTIGLNLGEARLVFDKVINPKGDSDEQADSVP